MYWSSSLLNLTIRTAEDHAWEEVHTMASDCLNRVLRHSLWYQIFKGIWGSIWIKSLVGNCTAIYITSLFTRVAQVLSDSLAILEKIASSLNSPNSSTRISLYFFMPLLQWLRVWNQGCHSFLWSSPPDGWLLWDSHSNRILELIQHKSAFLSVQPWFPQWAPLSCDSPFPILLTILTY